MRIFYFIAEKTEDAFDHITDPSHGFYILGTIIGRILMFGAGIFLGLVLRGVILGVLRGFHII